MGEEVRQTAFRRRPLENVPASFPQAFLIAEN
jgi:hypothetical protein